MVRARPGVGASNTLGSAALPSRAHYLARLESFVADMAAKQAADGELRCHLVLQAAQPHRRRCGAAMVAPCSPSGGARDDHPAAAEAVAAGGRRATRQRGEE